MSYGRRPTPGRSIWTTPIRIPDSCLLTLVLVLAPATGRGEDEFHSRFPGASGLSAQALLHVVNGLGLARHDLAAATMAVGRACIVQAGHPLPHALYGTLLAAGGRLRPARLALLRALALRPGARGIVPDPTRLLGRRGFERLLETLTTRARGGAPGAYTLLGAFLRASGRVKEGNLMLERALAADKHDHLASMALAPGEGGSHGAAYPTQRDPLTRNYLDPFVQGGYLFRAGKYLEAADSFALAALTNPAFAPARFEYAHALFAAGRLHHAARVLERALAGTPRWVERDLDRRDFYGDPADLARQQERLRIEIATRLRELQKEQVSPVDRARQTRRTAGLLTLFGYNYLFSGDAANAATFLGEALNLQPDHRPARLLLEAARQRRRTRRASPSPRDPGKKDYGARPNPNPMIAAAVRLSERRFAEGRYEEAGQKLKAALIAHPDLAAFRLDWAERAGSTLHARRVAELTRHVKENPLDQEARLLLGILLYFQRDLLLARFYLKSIIHQNPYDKIAEHFLARASK